MGGTEQNLPAHGLYQSPRLEVTPDRSPVCWSACGKGYACFRDPGLRSDQHPLGGSRTSSLVLVFKAASIAVLDSLNRMMLTTVVRN